MINTEETPQTPLQNHLAKTSKILGIGALIICGIIFILGLFQHISPLEMFMISISLAVAAIPEGLPAVVTIVLAIVFVADRVISRVLRKILDNSQIPSASIFVNLTRVTIWVTGAAMVLQPVFGINPTTLITALGVGGVAISLGLKDTIANIIGGFGLMLGRVIQPGDLVTIQGVTGTVHDITWRQTVVRTRSGDMMVIPNSVLNTAALTKLTPASEGMATLEFTAKASGDPSAISQDILDRVTKATADVALEGQPPLVKFTGFSPYGMTGQVLVFAREGVLPSTIKDMAARAIAGSGTEYLVEDGGSSGNL